MDGSVAVEFFLKNPGELSAFSAAIAPSLRPGDLIALSGELGAGKSHFARAAIQARLAATGRNEDVPSPTYTLVQTYWDGKAELWHADLYRLASTDGLDELGLWEALETAIVFVEWPELLLADGSEAALDIRLAVGTEGVGRLATVRANAPHIKSALAAIKT